MNKFIGTIVEAGTDCNGVPRLVIETTEEQLRAMAVLPLYRKVEFTITDIEQAPQE